MPPDQKKTYAPDTSKGNIIWMSSLGIHLVLTSVAGFFIGHFIDGWAHTGPLFTAIFFLLGIVAGFREIFRQMEMFDKKEQNGKNPEGKE